MYKMCFIFICDGLFLYSEGKGMVWLFMQLHQLTASHNNPIDTNSYITSIIQRKLCLELLQGKCPQMSAGAWDAS